MPLPNAVVPSSRSKRVTQLTNRKKSSVPGWLGYVVLLLAMSGVGYVALGKIRSAQSEAGELREQLLVANTRAASADQEAMAAVAGLVRSEQQLAQSSASLAAAEKAAAAKAQAADELESKLEALLEDGQGQVLKGADGSLTLQLVDKVLFTSGEAELTKRGQRVMTRVGVALREMEDKQVWVQGHTDNVPIQKDNPLFQSNWELSAMRALTVVHFLEDTSGVDPRRLAAAAFGSHRPVSRRKKAKNRRIEIVLFPRDVKLAR
tara:strand:+ start:99500 stop:100288 length:789 start_codon:yes stop_codon:yes gene_type:complete